MACGTKKKFSIPLIEGCSIFIRMSMSYDLTKLKKLIVRIDMYFPIQISNVLIFPVIPLYV